MPAQPSKRRLSGKVADELPWICDWSWEHHEAFRVRPGGANPKKESTPDVFSKFDSLDASSWARWPDGHEAELPALLKGSYDAWLKENATRKGKKGVSTVFTGTRNSDSSTVSVSYRSERPGSEMWGIYGTGSKQITQVLLQRFGDPSDDDTKNKSKDVAIKLARMFCDEDISKDELVSRRDGLLPPKAKQSAKQTAKGSAASVPPPAADANQKAKHTAKRPATSVSRPSAEAKTTAKRQSADAKDRKEREADDKHRAVPMQLLHDMTAIPESVMDFEGSSDGYLTPSY